MDSGTLLVFVALVCSVSSFSADHHHAHPAPQFAPPPPVAVGVPVVNPLCGCYIISGDAPLPPPPPPPTTGEPVPPLCGCVERGRCAESLQTFTDLVVRTHASELVCGSKYQLCCYENDPWPGVQDTFAHLAPCTSEDACRRPYGTFATDVRDFGVIGPCPGLGAVRCLDDLAPLPQPEPVPVHVVVPIVETPPPPPPPAVIAEPPPPSTIYEPPVVYEPPPPSTIYEPPVVYEPPTTEPPTTTTTTTTTTTPAPPPPPPVGYELPPPSLYQPPPQVEEFVAPPPVPAVVVAPPTQILATSYGIPAPAPFLGGGNYYGGRFFPGAGIGFQKHFGFSKGFGFFG